MKYLKLWKSVVALGICAVLASDAPIFAYSAQAGIPEATETLQEQRTEVTEMVQEQGEEETTVAETGSDAEAVTEALEEEAGTEFAGTEQTEEEITDTEFMGTEQTEEEITDTEFAATEQDTVEVDTAAVPTEEEPIRTELTGNTDIAEDTQKGSAIGAAESAEIPEEAEKTQEPETAEVTENPEEAEAVELENIWKASGDFSFASAISIGGTINGAITETAAERIYKFQLNQAGRIDLTMTSYMKYYCIYIYSSDGECVWDTDNNQWNENLKYRRDTHQIDLTAGSYYLKVTGYRIYDWDASTGNYTLRVNAKASLGAASVKAISNKAYTGKAIKPSLTVTYNGTRLKAGKDYSVTYKNNKSIGTATVTIKGKGNYTGTKTVKFKIVPGKVSIKGAKNSGKSAVTVSWKKVSGATGYEIYRSTRKSSGYKKVKTISKGSTLSYKNTKLKKGKTYYYKVRAYKKVNGKKVYGSYSSVKSVKVRK